LLHPHLQMPQSRADHGVMRAIQALEEVLMTGPPARGEPDDPPVALVQFLRTAQASFSQKLQQAGGNWSAELDELVTLNGRILQAIQAYQQRWDEIGTAAIAMHPAAAARPPPPLPPQMPEIDSQCQFCLEARAAVVLAPCLHKLCQRCLAMPREGRGSHSRSCPFCRGPVSETRAIDASSRAATGPAEASDSAGGARLKAFTSGDRPHEKAAPAKHPSGESQAKQRMALEHYQVSKCA
jgi:hypothetical protein